MRRSISCMVAGLMVAFSAGCFAIPDWHPRGHAFMAVLTIGIAGLMVVWDEALG
jgi:hypothetical protein